jgi:hypothetical protein
VSHTTLFSCDQDQAALYSYAIIIRLLLYYGWLARRKHQALERLINGSWFEGTVDILIMRVFDIPNPMYGQLSVCSAEGTWCSRTSRVSDVNLIRHDVARSSTLAWVQGFLNPSSTTTLIMPETEKLAWETLCRNRATTTEENIGLLATADSAGNDGDACQNAAKQLLETRNARRRRESPLESVARGTRSYT